MWNLPEIFRGEHSKNAWNHHLAKDPFVCPKKGISRKQSYAGQWDSNHQSYRKKVQGSSFSGSSVDDFSKGLPKFMGHPDTHKRTTLTIPIPRDSYWDRYGSMGMGPRNSAKRHISHVDLRVEFHSS